MSQILRQSTQRIVHIGPFVDVTDGFTPETGITLGAADEAEALKGNVATTTSISAATWAAITGCDGWYALTLTTSHTDTIGALDVIVQDDSVCLPVFARFQVIEEAAYDAIYATSASPATTTGVLAVETDTQDIQSRLPASLFNNRMDSTIDGTGMESGAVTAVQSGLATTVNVSAVETDTQDIQARLPAALSSDGYIKSDILALNASTTVMANVSAGFVALVSSTCAAGSTTTAIETNLTEATADHFNGRTITFTGGSLLGQSSDITDYNGTSKQLTVTALTEAPADTDPFVIS